MYHWEGPGVDGGQVEAWWSFRRTYWGAGVKGTRASKFMGTGKQKIGFWGTT